MDKQGSHWLIESPAVFSSHQKPRIYSGIMVSVLINVLLPINVSFVITVRNNDVVSIDDITVMLI